MKLTVTLHNNDKFYYSKDYEYSLCEYFIKTFLGERPSKVNVVFSSTNPKKKGFKKIVKPNLYWVVFKEKEFITSIFQSSFLNDQGVKDGDSFWLKIESAS